MINRRLNSADPRPIVSGRNSFVMLFGNLRYNPPMSDTVHRHLLSWYRAHGRHRLPWRETRDPYRIWVSEIMLQQTQVKTVLERFYFPFLERFPTLQSLAAAHGEPAGSATAPRTFTMPPWRRPRWTTC